MRSEHRSHGRRQGALFGLLRIRITPQLAGKRSKSPCRETDHSRRFLARRQTSHRRLAATRGHVRVRTRGGLADSAANPCGDRKGCENTKSIPRIITRIEQAILHVLSDGERFEPRVLRSVGNRHGKIDGAVDHLELAQEAKQDCGNRKRRTLSVR